MKYPLIPFATLPPRVQEDVILAERPRLHLEPVVFHNAANHAETTLAVHMQIGKEHAVFLESEFTQLQKEIDLVEAKLAAYRQDAG